MKTPLLRLDQIQPPVMPATRVRLQALLDQATTRTPHLQDVLLGDPGAVLAVFRELERVRPGAGEQATDVAHAVSLIGMDRFRRLLGSLSDLGAAQPAPAAGTGLTAAYGQAAHAACYAAALAGRQGATRPTELVTAAVLHQPAVLALWLLDPDAAQRASYATHDGVALETAFSAELGEPLAKANRRLAERWALPSLARQAMDGHGDHDPRRQAVRLAERIAAATAVGWYGEQTLQVNAQLADFLGIDDDRACSWMHCAAVDAARELAGIGYPLTGFTLLQPPGDVEEEDDEDIPLMGQVRRRPPAGPATGAPEAPTPPASSAAADLNGRMAGLMRRIRHEAGAARVVFAMLNRERSRLRTRLALGGAADDRLRHLDLDLAQQNLFSLLMQKPQSVWLNADNAARYQRYLPGGLRNAVAPGGAFLMSLFVGDRPLGLIYGDGGHLDDQGYRQFRTLCKEAVDALTAGSASAPKAAPIPQTLPS
ncbi:MAG: HDOD domain-containing protein [Chromatiaceae bacterium]|nr:HDOD domain-containing protein [Chromatiaceae bacterium]